jgi:hypothetical protein
MAAEERFYFLVQLVDGYSWHAYDVGNGKVMKKAFRGPRVYTVFDYRKITFLLAAGMAVTGYFSVTFA